MKTKEWKENEDYAVGDKIELPDGEIVEVMIENKLNPCGGCFLNHRRGCGSVKCSHYLRSDKTNIIFSKIKQEDHHIKNNVMQQVIEAANKMNAEILAIDLEENIILCKRNDVEYVTLRIDHYCNGFSGGHYFTDYEKARKDFNKRCK